MYLRNRNGLRAQPKEQSSCGDPQSSWKIDSHETPSTLRTTSRNGAIVPFKALRPFELMLSLVSQIVRKGGGHFYFLFIGAPRYDRDCANASVADEPIQE
jgi:hypothetical protein